MIKFFRHIRQKLLAEGKTANYFKYAIGEIFLVVIGILIALQINNWNEGRKDRVLEQTFLIKLKSNLQDDASLYKDRIDKNMGIYNHLDTSLSILKNYKSHSTEDLQEHLRHIFLFNRFNTNRTTFDNLLSSSKLSVIRNDSLTQKLFLYYRGISLNQESLDESIDAYSRNTFGPSLFKFDFFENSLGLSSNPKMSSFGLKPLKSYVENPEIVNHISHKMQLIKAVVNAYKRQKENVDRIINTIDSELKQTK